MKTRICYLIYILCFAILNVKSEVKNYKECKPFYLKIKVFNLDTGKIRIMYNNCNDTSARYTANLKNGEASFTGFINNASEALLITDLSSTSFNLDGPKVIRFIIEAKSMTLSYSINSLGAYNIKIDGSNSQNELVQWQNKNNSNLNLIDTLSEKLSKNLSPDQKAIIVKQIDSLYLNITQKVKSHVLYNRESYTSTYLLKKYWRKIPIDTLKAYYSQLSTSAHENEIGKNLLDDILTSSPKDEAFVFRYGTKNLVTQLKNATNFLDFSLLDFNGKPIDLREFKNKYTFINIWASWCEPCIKNIPQYEKVKREYINQQINFVSISIDKNIKDWKKSIKLNNLTGFNLIDMDGILKSFYKIQEVPFYMIIKPDGNVAEMKVSKPGSSQLYKIIDSYLKNNSLESKL